MSGRANRIEAPHSVEAEQSVLAALLLDNRAFDVVGGILTPGHFYAGAHASIYGAVAALLVAGQPADVVTVAERSGHDIAYLNELAVAVPSASNAKRYAEIVVEHWRERELLAVGRRLATREEHDSTRNVDARCDAAVARLLAIGAQAGEREPVALNAMLPPWLDHLQAVHEGRAEPAISTGLDGLDRLTAGGGRRGELWVIGARPSMGKSAMSLGIARHVARTHAVLALSMEDSANTYVSRLVASAGGVNLADLRNPARAPDSMWTGVSEGVDALSGLTLHVDDQAALTLQDVRRKIGQVRRRNGALDLVLVDYLQLMTGQADTRNRELGDIANGLKAAAKEHDVWVVLLSQLNRRADERSGAPHMGDLRESGDIEGAADVIGMLHREAMRKPTVENKEFAEFNVCKNKNGPTDTVLLRFDGAHQRFSSWVGPRPKAGRAVSARGDDGGLS